MKVILFGATGMVGRGVLRECLLDGDVETVLSIGRTATGQQNPKLREIVRKDLANNSGAYDSDLESELCGYDACFFCLGVSSAGISEDRYRHITYDITLAAARTLVRLNPAMTFIYVSGTGTDSTERGRSMWARVKGETENALLRLPFRAVYLFRPGIIRPMHGIVSKTHAYRILYALLGPVIPLLQFLFPRYIVTTEQLGRAMIRVARRGFARPILEQVDIRGR